jgi:hypothetical protein
MLNVRNVLVRIYYYENFDCKSRTVAYPMVEGPDDLAELTRCLSDAVAEFNSRRMVKG